MLFLQAFGILVDDDLGVRKGCHDGVLDLVGDGVGAHQRHVRVHLQMELDEGCGAGAARAQVVQGQNLRVAERDPPDNLALVVRQFAIQQHVERRRADLARVPQQPQHDADGEQRIEPGPAPHCVGGQRDDDAAVQRQVAGIVQRVALDRDRPGAPHDMALEGDQHQGQHNRKDHHRDADRFVAHGAGIEQAPDRLDQQQHARAADEGGLAEAGQRLRLAVAEAVFAVGRLDGVAHREQRHDGGRGVEEGIDQGGEDGDRVRHQPGGQLGGDQHRRDDDGGDRRLFLQADLDGRVGERSGRRRGGLLCGGLGHIARKIGRPATCLNRAVLAGPSQPGLPYTGPSVSGRPASGPAKEKARSVRNRACEAEGAGERASRSTASCRGVRPGTVFRSGRRRSRWRRGNSRRRCDPT